MYMYKAYEMRAGNVHDGNRKNASVIELFIRILYCAIIHGDRKDLHQWVITINMQTKLEITVRPKKQIVILLYCVLLSI